MGKISAVTLSPPRCRVHYGAQDEGDAETPPLRWITLSSGDTRRWAPPTVGEEVIVFCPDGQIGNGVVLTGLINDNFPAAGSTLAELVTYKDGAMIGYDPETHTLAATLPAGSSATIKADAITLDVPNVEITGTLAVGEDVIIAGRLSLIHI